MPDAAVRENDREAPIKTVWPSGLRRWLQAPVRKGVGSNPTAVSIVRAGCVGNFGFEEAKKNKNGTAGIKTCFW